MRSPILKILTLVLGLCSLGAGVFFVMQVKGVVSSIEKSEHAAEEKKKEVREIAAEEKAIPWVSLDEIFVNVSGDKGGSRSMAVRIDLELFEDIGREFIERYQSSIRHSIIQTALEQRYSSLKTLEGKLYFKEVLVSKINTLINKAVVRDVHFGSFYLQ